MILCMKPNLMSEYQFRVSTSNSRKKLSEYQFRVSTSNSRKKSALNDVFKKAIENICHFTCYNILIVTIL